MPVLQVRITDAQQDELHERAEDAGVSVSEYVRVAILDPSPASDDPAFRAAVVEHEQRIAELEAWHARSKAMQEAYRAKGWASPLDEDEAGYAPIRLSQFQRASRLGKPSPPIPKS